MGSKKSDLLSLETAAEVLHLDEAELAEQIEAGNLRRVWHRAGNSAAEPLESYLLGEDVRRLARESDPEHMARLVGRGGGAVSADPDDDDSPSNLAQSVPRL